MRKVKQNLMLAIMISSLLLGSFCNCLRAKAEEVQNVSGFQLVNTNYGVEQGIVKAKELQILSNNITVLDYRLSNLLILKEDVNENIVRIHFLGPNGVLKTFELSATHQWVLDIIEAESSNALIEQIIDKLECAYGYEGSEYNNCIYRVKNPEGKYDLININTGKYYDYGFDMISYPSRKDEIIEYTVNGMKGLLDFHGEKLTEAIYTAYYKIRDGYYYVCSKTAESDKYGILSTDGVFDGGLDYSYIQYKTYNGNISNLILTVKEDKTISIIYPELRKEVDISYIAGDQWTGVILGINDALLCEYSEYKGNSIWWEKWAILDENANKKSVSSLFGGAYNSIDFCENDINMEFTTYNIIENKRNRDITGVINSDCEIVFDATQYSPNQWSCTAIDDMVYVAHTLDDQTYTYEIINQDSEVIYTFTNDYPIHDANSNDCENISYVNDYVIIQFDENTYCIINNKTKEKIELNNVKTITTSEDFAIGKNQYIVVEYLAETESCEIINLYNGKRRAFSCSNEIIEAIIVDGEVGAILINDSQKTSLVSSNLEVIMEDIYYEDYSYFHLYHNGVPKNMADSAPLKHVCKDGKLYTLKGELISNEEWKNYSSTYYGESLISIYQSGERGYRNARYAYIDLYGNIVLDDNYYYLSDLYDGLSYFAKRGDYKSDDESGVMDKSGEKLISGYYINRFDYGSLYYMQDVLPDGGGIILQKQNENYILYNWNDYHGGEEENKPIEKVTVQGTTSGQASSKLKIGNNIQFTIPEDVPIIGGGDMELDFSVIPVQYEQSGNNYKIGIGVKDLTNFSEGNWIDLKKFVNSQKEDYKKGINALLASKLGSVDMGWSVKPKIECYGYAEGVITQDGVQSCEGKMMIEIKVNAKDEWQTTVVVVPVVIKLSGEVGIETTVSLGLDLSNGYVYAKGSIDLILPKIKLSTGVGVAYIADISVYGSLNNIITITEKDTMQDGFNQSVKATLTGEAGVSAKLLFASYEKALLTGTLEYYNVEKKLFEEKSDVLSAFALPNKVDEYIIERKSPSWSINRQSELEAYGFQDNSITTISSDVYADTKPLFVQTDIGKQVLIYTTDIENRTTGNHTAIVYSIYDDENVKWSDPIILDDDGTADFYPSVAVNGENVVIAWSNCNKVFTDSEVATNTFLTDVASSCEIEIAILNPATGQVTKEQLTNDEYTDLNASVTSINEEIYITWYKNTNNDIIQLSGNNHICLAQKSASWEVSTLVESDKPITDVAIGNLQEKPVIVYITNDNQKQDIITDTEMIVMDLQGKKIHTIDDAVCKNPQFSSVNGEKALLWYMETEKDSNIAYMTRQEDDNDLILETGSGITSDYCMINGTDVDLILYTDINMDGDGRELYAYRIKADEVSQSVKLTDEDNYMANPVGIYDGDTYRTVFLKKTAEFEEENLIERVDLCMLNLEEKGKLEIQSIDYVEESMLPGETTELSIMIKNNGIKDLSGEAIQILDGENVIGSLMLTDMIAVGETKEYVVQITLPSDMEISDTYVVQLIKDNETKEQTITPGFTDVELSTEATVDGYIVQVINVGGFSTDASLVIYDKQADGKELKRYNLGTLESGENVEKEFSKEELGELGESLCFSVVAENNLKELFECNNNSYLYVGENIIQSLNYLEASKEKVTYEIGDELTINDLVVKAVYEDNTEKEITGYSTNAANIDMSTEGEKTLIITYEENYVVRTVSFVINVVKKQVEDGENENRWPENEPSTEKPSTEKPSTEKPNTEEPSTEEPSTEKPNTEEPSTEEPSTEKPTTEEPSTEMPSSEESKNETPSTETPETEIPSTEAPGKENSTTQGNENLPKVGTKVTVSFGIYKVTKSTADAKEVVFVKPKNSKKTSVAIPDKVKISGYTYKVTEIAAKAFKNNKTLKYVTIGKNVKKIGQEAFSGCKKLKKITIKSTVLKSVGKNAIKNIYKKATIKVPKKKLSKYKKLFKSTTGYKKTMKINTLTSQILCHSKL